MGLSISPDGNKMCIRDSFHIRTHRDDAAVKITRADRTQHRLLFCVTANGLCHIVRNMLDIFLIFIQRKDFLSQRRQFTCHR